MTPCYNTVRSTWFWDRILPFFSNQCVASVWCVIPIYNSSFSQIFLIWFLYQTFWPSAITGLYEKKSIMVKFLFFLPFNKFISDWLRPRRRTQKRLINLVNVWFQNFCRTRQLIGMVYRGILSNQSSRHYFPNYLSMHFFIIFLTFLTALSAGFEEWSYELENSITMYKLEQYS